MTAYVCMCVLVLIHVQQPSQPEAASPFWLMLLVTA
jgi:hypothetical protein